MAASGCKSCCKSCCWDPVKGCIDAVLENKLVKDIRLVVTLFMAVTSYVAVFKEFDQKFIDRKLDLSFSPPDDRCVPYFDKAEQLVQGQEPNSILYSYVDGEPQVRLCTNRTEAEVDALLGAANRYDSLSEATNGNCSFANATQVWEASQQCENNGILNCTAAFFTPPAPNGMVWLYGISGLEDPPAPCTTSIRAFDEDRVSSPCNQPRLLVYLKRNPGLKALFITAFAMTLLRAVAEVMGVVKYHRDGTQGFFLTMADDGAAGPLYYAALTCFCGDKPKPTVPPYTLNDWFTIQVMEAVVNIALPSVAIVGCKPRGLLTIAFVQLIAGIVKSVVMFAYNVYERSKENVNNDVVTNNIFHGV